MAKTNAAASSDDEPEVFERESTPPASSGETVTVACKLPHGLLLRVYDMVDAQEPVLGGGIRQFKRPVQRPEQFLIQGSAVPFGIIPGFRFEGGYALTEGVPKELWERWFEANKGSDMVKNGLIFAHTRLGHALGQAHEQIEVLSGLEPLKMKDDPRVPKSLNPAISEVEAAKRK